MCCVFCNIVNKEIDAYIIYQSDLITCFLDSDPINEGHALIIPNKHYLDIDEIPLEILTKMMELSKEVVSALKKKYTMDGYSIMQNGGIFNDVGHYHLHIFPRYKQDGFAWTYSDARYPVDYCTAEELKKLLRSK